MVDSSLDLYWWLRLCEKMEVVVETFSNFLQFQNISRSRPSCIQSYIRTLICVKYIGEWSQYKAMVPYHV